MPQLQRLIGRRATLAARHCEPFWPACTLRTIGGRPSWHWGYQVAEQADRIELHYDRLGTRVVAIGDTEIEYDWAGSRARRVGEREIHYDQLGQRLKWIGDQEIHYDHLGQRVRWLGDAEITYDHLGTRIQSIDGLACSYDQAGSRPRWLGDLELEYDRLGTRLKYVTPHGDTGITPEIIEYLFLILHEEERKSFPPS